MLMIINTQLVSSFAYLYNYVHHLLGYSTVCEYILANFILQVQEGQHLEGSPSQSAGFVLHKF
jgi:hypothetical protein